MVSKITPLGYLDCDSGQMAGCGSFYANNNNSGLIAMNDISTCATCGVSGMGIKLSNEKLCTSCLVARIIGVGK